MANFALTNSTGTGSATNSSQQNLTGTYKSIVTAGNSSANANTFFVTGAYRRGKFYDILIGTNGTPADNFVEWDCVAITLGTTPTGTGTISSISSNWGVDAGDFALNAAVILNSTAELGITAIADKWYIGINQRASYRWVAAPGSEFVYPAISSALVTGFSYNGLSLRARSAAYTSTVTGTVLLSEQ
jgi:hypothetical protein